MLFQMYTIHSISLALSLWFITWDLWLWSIIDWLSCSTTAHLLVLQGLWYISINDTSCKSFNDSSLSNSWLANDDLKQQGGRGLTEGTWLGLIQCYFLVHLTGKVDMWSDITNLHCRTQLTHTGRKLDYSSIFVPGFGSPQIKARWDTQTVNILGPAILQSMYTHVYTSRAR